MRKPRFWNIPVPYELDNMVEDAIKGNAHISKAEFVRDAVRRYLEKRG